VLLDKYPFIADADHLTYKFLSEGPKGVIQKAVSYQLFVNNIFNLAFGDWNESKQKIDDVIRSNNKDYAKVLTTVAFTVIDFINFHPGATIQIKGSTPSRTRLYQMSIQANLHEISNLFMILGFRNGKWELFEKGVNYELFLLRAR
jgi:hypothetical protein